MNWELEIQRTREGWEIYAITRVKRPEGEEEEFSHLVAFALTPEAAAAAMRLMRS